MSRQNQRLTSKLIAFTAVMCAVANVLGLFFSIPIGLTKIHLMQLPMILSGLALGPWIGGLVGFIGATTMAFNLPSPNLYILPGNAILGFFTGLFYLRLKTMKGRPIIPQMISVLGAYIVQFPYVYVTDVYLMPLTAGYVLTVILPKLLLEDMVSALLAHFILFRVKIAEILR
jgi:energy coupling factor transporter S component ThiW